MQGYIYFSSAKPTQAHQLIGKLENENYVTGVITQNVDALHQKGGSNHVVELHGKKRKRKRKKDGRNVN